MSFQSPLHLAENTHTPQIRCIMKLSLYSYQYERWPRLLKRRFFQRFNLILKMNDTTSRMKK